MIIILQGVDDGVRVFNLKFKRRVTITNVKQLNFKRKHLKRFLTDKWRFIKQKPSERNVISIQK